MQKLFALAILLALGASTASAQETRKPPYWASIASGEALMRTGPGKNYPAVWLYKRADLPIKVIETYPSWRKIQDPDGAIGWMLVNLLSDTRTALVKGDGPQPIRKTAAADADVLYLAQPGVVGRIAKCDGNWCRIAIGGKSGFIETAHVWGLDPGESVP